LLVACSSRAGAQVDALPAETGGGAVPALAEPQAPAEPAASAPDPGPGAAASAAPAVGRPVELEVGEPRFTSGDVPKAKAALERLAKKLEACVDEAGGISGDKAELEVQFLVRAAGVAEGVDVIRATGVPAAAKKCVTGRLQEASIGTPSSDPVGVTVVLQLVPRP
jgi:hypothetical protein